MLRQFGRLSIVFLFSILLASPAVSGASESSATPAQTKASLTVKVQSNVPSGTLVKVVRDGKVVTEKVVSGAEYPAGSIFVLPPGAAANLIFSGSDGRTYFLAPKMDALLRPMNESSQQTPRASDITVNELSAASIEYVVMAAADDAAAAGSTTPPNLIITD